MERRTGISSLAYTGVQARTPAEFLVEARAPLVTDYIDYFVGTFWLHMPVKELYFLSLIDKNQGYWVKIGNIASSFQTITGNVGGSVGYDGMSNINLVGSGSHVVTGTPGTWTLSLDGAGLIALSFLTDDTNSAIPAAGVLQVVGSSGIVTSSATNVVTIDGSAISGSATTYEANDTTTASTIANILKVYGDGVLTATTAATNIVTVGLASSVATDGEILIGRTGNTPIWNSIASAGGTFVITPGVGAINLESIPVPALVYAGENINIAPAGTINLNETIRWPISRVSTEVGTFYTDLISPHYEAFLRANASPPNTSVHLGMKAGSISDLARYCTSVGSQAGSSPWILNGVTAIGVLALNLTRNSYNTAAGSGCMFNTYGTAYNTCGLSSTGVGHEALYYCLGSRNVGIGRASGLGAYGYHDIMLSPFASDNTLFAGTTTRLNNKIRTGYRNSFFGRDCGIRVINGIYNIAIGYRAAYNCIGSESSSISIGNYGTAGNNIIRIGTHGAGVNQQDKCFVAGVRGITTGVADAISVLVDSGHQLGTVSSSIKCKENIFDMGYNSDAIYDLEPTTFEYKSHPGVKQYGLIAEDVESVFPNLVVKNVEGLPETVKYHTLSVLLLNEIIKLENRIKELEKKVL